MLTRILLAALLAGVLSGVFVTAVQAYRVTPLILEAETYENSGGEGAVAPSDGHSHDHSAVTTPKDQPAAAAHDAVEEAEAWAPEDGVERTLYTMAANVLVGVSFSLILVAGVLLTKSTLSLQSGLVWGMCGFVVFVLAPNFGLSPELPGMDAADLTQRQSWWVATVVATAAALLIFAFKRNIFWMAAGLALLVAPHLYGAPMPATHDSIVPANLAAEFVVATIVSSFLFWMFLGGSLGWLVERVSGEPDSPPVR